MLCQLHTPKGRYLHFDYILLLDSQCFTQCSYLPFVIREMKTHFFGSPLYVYLFIKNIWLTGRHNNLVICRRDTFKGTSI